MYRSADGRLVAGIAAGLAEHLGVATVIVRAAFVVLTAAGGAGLLLYGGLWAFVPQQPLEAPGVAAGRRAVDRGQLVAFGCLAVGFVLLANVFGFGVGGAVVWPVVVAGAGAALIWRQADDVQRSRWLSTARSPWRTEGGQRVEDRRRTARTDVLRVLAGLVLVVAGLAGFLAANHALVQARRGLLAIVTVLVGLAVVAGPWLIRMVGDLSAERRERTRSQERAEIAARVHDSVLHTLALIQRSAEHPREVARLARAQERDLRSWLYRPAAAKAADRLGRAVEEVAAEVEDVYAVSMDVIVVGDTPLDEPLYALVQAAREAMVNAAKSSGAPAVSVYVEVEEDCVSAFVRDRGKGFELDGVDEDRFGIRESIIGRMTRYGGTAEIRTAPGEGTEVQLTVARRPS